MNRQSEFAVENAYPYTRSSAARWVLSHIWRYKFLLIGSAALWFTAWFLFSYTRVLIGDAATIFLDPVSANNLLTISIVILIMLLTTELGGLIGAISLETIAQRLARDAREELYVSLLGKSQIFHDRQRVGDIMARATDDVSQLNAMINPGILFLFEIIMGLATPILFILAVQWQLALIPLLFTATYVVAVRFYARRLNPVFRNQRMSFGAMNAGLEETISGIEVVKATARETFERKKFARNARKYRDYFAEQGRVEARYLPMLLYAFALGGTFLHSMILFTQGAISIPDIIAVIGLVQLLRFPIFISIFSLSLITLGIAGAERILHIINAKADLDENSVGYSRPIKGEIRFENVTFGYDPNDPIIKNISFHVNPGETVAIVGQTGSGKSTLTELINRTYDATAGRILIDGVDARDWSLDSLRSQISRIEQDVFLFSRTLAENIAFSAPEASQEEIEKAARAAQAHDFIQSFTDGYHTESGERGVTLSGGQRQRIALARAFLSDPRILILDDSTSAIDSATEDEIQKAIREIQKDRTTILITHRLSQIRRADHILLLESGELIARGTHEELLRTSELYRRIFARYDAALPPLEKQPA